MPMYDYECPDCPSTVTKRISKEQLDLWVRYGGVDKIMRIKCPRCAADMVRHCECGGPLVDIGVDDGYDTHVFWCEWCGRAERHVYEVEIYTPAYQGVVQECGDLAEEGG